LNIQDSIKKKNRTANKNVKKQDKAESKTRESASFDSSDDENYVKASKAKPVTVFMIGGPGSGLGTQAEKLVAHYGFTHLSLDDILRDEKTSSSTNGKVIEDCIAEGRPVPVRDYPSKDN